MAAPTAARPRHRPGRLAALRPPALAVALLLAGRALCGAQDAHYWTYGYGPIGQLTEGTLVGGVSDLSAVYYNPGALALIEEPRFVFGLTSIELARIEAPDAAGAHLDFDSTVFDTVPALIAAHVGRSDGQRDQFAFAFLSRHDTDWDLGYSDARVSGAVAEASAGFGRVRERVVEYWVGGTWSRRVRPGLSFGVTPFLAYRAQRSRRSLALESSSADGVTAAFTAGEHEYNHGRALAKLGVAWRPGSLELGVTVTTPGIGIYDKGKVVFNASAAGQAPGTLLSASTQRNLAARFHSPWSVAGGATWRGRRTALHTTLEWFGAVAPYDILAPAPAPLAGSERTVPLDFGGAAAEVLNLGVGVERQLGERLTVYGGAARNGSSWRPGSETLAAWDLLDCTAGFAWAAGRSRLALGLGYAWGTGDLPQAVAPPGEAVQLSTTTTQGRFGRWTFSLGVSVEGQGK